MHLTKEIELLPYIRSNTKRLESRAHLYLTHWGWVLFWHIYTSRCGNPCFFDSPSQKPPTSVEIYRQLKNHRAYTCSFQLVHLTLLIYPLGYRKHPTLDVKRRMPTHFFGVKSITHHKAKTPNGVTCLPNLTRRGLLGHCPPKTQSDEIDMISMALKGSIKRNECMNWEHNEGYRLFLKSRTTAWHQCSAKYRFR